MSASTVESTHPANIGILAMEMYFPLRCISLADLEQYNCVPKGKYTIGLGQQYMAWTDDREDINSFALNAVSGLLKKYNIDPKSIGRLEVGTETLIDKSKSVKTTLMGLFAESGNFDVEGIDSKNACYGSTAALYNAINWIESSSWDGRNAIVVAADIAVYADGPARPAGACAMLIGPNAPVVFEPVHGSYMADTYDFYKPNLSSEYPEVDGPGSVATYIQAFDSAYASFKNKLAKSSKKLRNHRTDIARTNETLESLAKPFSLQHVDYALFHTPYVKQTIKGHARMLYQDFLAAPQGAHLPDGDDRDPRSLASTLATDKDVERAFIDLGKASFAQKVDPTLACARRLGNLYTASLYGCLASLLSTVPSSELQGKRASLYAFGGGCAASFWTLQIVGDISEIQEKMDLLGRLAQMRVVPCQDFMDALELREKRSHAGAYSPQGSTDNIWPGAYYLENVDVKYRRKYSRAGGASS